MFLRRFKHLGSNLETRMYADMHTHTSAALMLYCVRCAQTKALSRVMTSIEDELHESLLENDELSTTLESKTEQFTAVRVQRLQHFWSV